MVPTANMVASQVVGNKTNNMKKISAHDEREIGAYVKHNPTSLKSVIDQKHSVAKKMKPITLRKGTDRATGIHNTHKLLD